MAWRVALLAVLLLQGTVAMFPYDCNQGVPGLEVPSDMVGFGVSPEDGLGWNITSYKYDSINATEGFIIRRCLNSTTANPSDNTYSLLFSTVCMRANVSVADDGITRSFNYSSQGAVCPPDLSSYVSISPWNATADPAFQCGPAVTPASFIGGPGTYQEPGGQTFGIELTGSEYHSYLPEDTLVLSRCIATVQQSVTPGDGLPMAVVTLGLNGLFTKCYTFIKDGNSMYYVRDPLDDSQCPSDVSASNRFLLAGYFPDPSPSPSPSITASNTPSPSISPTPSGSPSTTPSVSPSGSNLPTPSVSPSGSGSSSPTSSVTPSSSIPASVSPSPSYSPSNSASPSVTYSPGHIPTPTATGASTTSATPTATPSPGSSASSSADPQPTLTATPTPSLTAGASPSTTPAASTTSTSLPSPAAPIIGAVLRIPIAIPGLMITNVRNNARFTNDVKTDIASALNQNQLYVAVDDRTIQQTDSGVIVTAVVTFAASGVTPASAPADIDAAVARAQGTANSTWLQFKNIFSTSLPALLPNVRAYAAFVLHTTASAIIPSVDVSTVVIAPSGLPPSPPPGNGAGGRLSTGAAAGIGVTFALLAAICVCAPFCYCRYQAWKKARNSLSRGSWRARVIATQNPLQQPGVVAEIKKAPAAQEVSVPAQPASSSARAEFSPTASPDGFQPGV